MGATKTNDPAVLIERRVGAWGRPDAIVDVVTQDAEWWITPTTGLPSPMVGRPQIDETLREVFGKIYDPARTLTEIQMRVGDDRSAAARFTMFSHVLLNDRPYQNEYALFIRTDASGERVERVWEYLDVELAMDQLGGS